MKTNTMSDWRAGPAVTRMLPWVWRMRLNDPPYPVRDGHPPSEASTCIAMQLDATEIEPTPPPWGAHARVKVSNPKSDYEAKPISGKNILDYSMGFGYT